MCEKGQSSNFGVWHIALIREMFYRFSITIGPEVAKYTDCISGEGYDFPNECPIYDTLLINGEAN